MVTLVFLLMALIVLTLSALRWGASSSEWVDSPEWERRQHWSGFH